MNMKKLLVCLALGMVVPGFAQAQDDQKENEFTISTQIRPRAEYRNGALYPREEGAEAAQFITNRARISMEYKRSDLIMKFSAQHVGVWGQDPQVDRNGRFALNEAWARLNFGAGFFGQAGRQILSYDDERLLGALDWNVAGRSHDALKLGYENPNNKLHLILAFNQNDEYFRGTYFAAGGQSYKSMQTLWYNYTATQCPLSVSLLLMNLGLETGDAATREGDTEYMQTFGTHVVFKPGSWNLSGSLYYQTGKYGSYSLSAFMASARAQYNISNQWSVMAASDYLSGDKEDSEKFKAFNPLFGTHHKFYGSMDYFFASGFINGFNPGLWDNQLGIGFKPSPKVALGLNYHYFLTATDVNSQGESFSKGLGSEFDFQVDWTIKKDIKFTAGYSVMKGTETMDIVKGGDHKAWQDWAFVSLNINPKVLFVKW